MASSRRSRLVPAMGALLLSALSVRSVIEAFANVSQTPSSRSSRTSLRVNLFDGFQKAVRDANEKMSGAPIMDDATPPRIVEVELPLGVEFEERDGGDIYVQEVDPSSNAYAQGVRKGAQLVKMSATFGDEMWSTRKVGMMQFQTVLDSRFGNSIRMALTKEDQNILRDLFDKIAKERGSGPDVDEEKAKMDQLEAEFNKGERELDGKNMWNPFR
eukprot:TRINITY_DN18353_c0_g2_i1.p1 TRINITY_DN18353_c0_g2~~TRINITY_DN18353_c0_g2_i1.p1  ORF type:complete len:215 (+),score=42.60 TRINITY_DN18353_c0_g2_i1:118-762(+)